MENNDNLNTNPEDVQVSWASSQSLGERLAGELKSVVDTLESGESIEQRFTMRTIQLDLEPRSFNADEIKVLREVLRASQAVFAQLLGVQPSTVQSWEQGSALPQGSSRRLLELMHDDPEAWITRLAKASKQVNV